MNIDMIRAAAGRLQGHARRTPILTSPFLDEIAGRRVFVKAECLQHTGSFKFRGGWSAVSSLTDNELKAGVIAFPAATMRKAWPSPPANTAHLPSSSCLPMRRR